MKADPYHQTIKIRNESGVINLQLKELVLKIITQKFGAVSHKHRSFIGTGRPIIVRICTVVYILGLYIFDTYAAF